MFNEKRDGRSTIQNRRITFKTLQRRKKISQEWAKKRDDEQKSVPVLGAEPCLTVLHFPSLLSRSLFQFKNWRKHMKQIFFLSNRLAMFPFKLFCKAPKQPGLAL